VKGKPIEERFGLQLTYDEYAHQMLGNKCISV
jgi:hypothetical protein